ncbi:hypothetical protein AB0K92_15050 [Streptomyces sp. NPDC052687]|uniref:hypothetical protein n=1 Tax=Streptomyces sp. NPDC052687 TaxID=3154759 RepID=UPI0034471A6B
MNVLVCAACGRPLTEPVRLLPGLPGRPAYDGLPNPDGSRHAPPTVPRGTDAVDPRPSGAPYVEDPDPLAERDHSVDTHLPAENGFPMISAGSRDTLVVNPEDTYGRVTYNPASGDHCCCGLGGKDGPNQLCAGCGAVVATQFSECYGPFETHFLPDAVRVEAAP